jgi:flagellar assembly factor FliW
VVGIMELRTKYHGTRQYEENDVITFEKGIPGFENLKKFIIFPAEENNLFYILQSIENINIGIVLVSPFNAIKDYEFKLGDSIISKLMIKNEKDVLVLNTVTLNSRIENITANLKAPIVININRKVGEQIILDNSSYPIKYQLFKEGA